MVRPGVVVSAGIDIVLSPPLKLTPELLLIAAVASPCLITFFDSADGGGG
jgi:hypothetical protein